MHFDDVTKILFYIHLIMCERIDIHIFQNKPLLKQSVLFTGTRF